jgi:hypothetical protein
VRAFSALAERNARFAAIAQLVEHVIRNDGVTGSSPVCGTSPWRIGSWSPNIFARFVRRPVEIRLSGREQDQTDKPQFCLASCRKQGDIVRIPTNPFSKRPLVLWCFPVLFLLSGCGEAGPECDTADARNSVIKNVADNKDNPLLNYAIENSNSIAQMLSHAKAEPEQAAIREKAKQDAIYSLDETIVVNSRTRAVATCTGLLYVKVGDTTAQKEVEFKVEQTADGKTSVSVSPFLF